MIANANGELTPAAIAPEMTRPWQVEHDFVQAVRAAQEGRTWSVSPDFEEGLRYMKKVEAILLSEREGCSVRLADL